MARPAKNMLAGVRMIRIMTRCLSSIAIGAALSIGTPMAGWAQQDDTRGQGKSKRGTQTSLGKPPTIFRDQGMSRGLGTLRGSRGMRQRKLRRRALTECQNYYGHRSVMVQRIDGGFRCVAKHSGAE